ncbi:ornithine decarboxylase antizyme-domain-containing protein [Lipomyces oligophaga]|uniref:ornithine decarboxylase antizyme-domain-containing protein n=1 Tax=Lipomyces oligophaga TaxID=45792 RepID=UPI0034CD776C
MALQCERLFANGTVIRAGIPELERELSKVRASGSSAVKSLVRVAYPSRSLADGVAAGRRGLALCSSNDETEFFSLVDVEENVWMGAVVDDTMLIYFDKEMLNSHVDLRSGLVAVMDLASELLHCQRVVLCIDRQILKLQNIVSTFYWVGFELVKCPPNINGGQLSDAWIAMDIEL